MIAMLLARVGLRAEASRAIASSKERGLSEGAIWNAQGELALSRGRRKEAIQLFQQGIASTRPPARGFYSFLLASESLARVWELEGNPENALRVLTGATAEKFTA